jgi:hypothetical protein
MIRLAFMGLAALSFLANPFIGHEALGAATVQVTSSPPESAWSDYQIIMWQPKNARQYGRLAEIGVTGAAMIVDRQEPAHLPQDRLQPLLASGLPWYAENIATDFYSAYHRWSPDHPVDWRFAAIKRLYRDNPRDPTVYRRVPSLSDPVRLAEIERRLALMVQTQRRYRPLFYDLGDETGIADLNAPWDFDFSDASLHGLRRWLRQQYGNLAALNREWGTDFLNWDRVMPPTTQEAMARGGDNFAPWSDFKAWMDLSYAGALKAGTDAVHRADPAALAGLEGVQLPGWGGYDYARIADAVDLMEAPPRWFPLLRSLNPRLALVNTLFGGGAGAAHRVWQAFLDGSRGLILWDANDEFIARDGNDGPRARDAMFYFRALRGGLGALIINSRRQLDPVAILYSQPSMRVEWMLDWRGRGDEWSRQDTDSQNRDNPWRGAMRRYMAAIVRLGLSPRFVTPEEIARGALRRNVRALILPDAIALSRGTADAIRRFVRGGGIAIADREPGLFDAHGRRVDEPPLRDLFRKSPKRGARQGRAVYLAPPPDRGPTDAFDPRNLAALRRVVRDAGVGSKISLTNAVGAPTDDVAVYRWRDGDISILGLERIRAGDFTPMLVGNKPAAAGTRIVIRLPHPAFVYDLPTGRSLGRRSRIDLTLDPVAPTLLALSPTVLSAPRIAGPTKLLSGRSATFQFRCAYSGHRDFDVLHVVLNGASGRPISGGTLNVLTRAGRATIHVRPALDAPPGRWTLTVSDVLSGQKATDVITLNQR